MKNALVLAIFVVPALSAADPASPLPSGKSSVQGAARAATQKLYENYAACFKSLKVIAGSYFPELSVGTDSFLLSDETEGLVYLFDASGARKADFPGEGAGGIL